MKPSHVHFTCVWKQKATVEIVVQSYVLLPRVRVVTVFCVCLRKYLFIYVFIAAVHRCRDFPASHPSYLGCCFREGNFTWHIPKQFACQLWIPASRSLTESCPKRSCCSSWGTRSEWQCSHVQTGQHDLGSAAVWELPCSLYLLGKYLSR